MLTPTADNPADPHDATTAGRSLQRSQEPNDLQDNGHSKIKPWITSGVGKTHLAQALGHAACRRGHSARFAKTSRLLSELAGGHADGTWEARMRRLVRVDLLILDDFGLREFTPQAGDDFFELVSERHKTGSMILTSNRAPTDWYGLFPNPVVAEGVLDRLVNCAHHLLMQGKSYRPNKRPGTSRASTQGDTSD